MHSVAFMYDAEDTERGLCVCHASNEAYFQLLWAIYKNTRPVLP